jgi:hypothetical protein
VTALTDRITRRHLECAYVDSDSFVTAALEWVSTHGHEDDVVFAAACAAYRESAEFATVIDDACTGERRF